MRHFQGTGAGTGFAAGPARLLSPRLRVEERRIAAEGVLAEQDRFDAALATTDSGMERVGSRSDATTPVGAEMVDVHRAILHSDELAHKARRMIRDRRIGAEWAVRTVVEQMRRVFAEIEDERFRARFEDVDSVAARLVRTLREEPQSPLDRRVAGCIAVGLELSPLDVLELHRLGAAGLATEHGGPTSHAAIVARALGIPYAFGVHGLVAGVSEDEQVCVDGNDGEVVASPDAAATCIFEDRRASEAHRRRSVEAVQHEPAITLDGTGVSIGGNVDSAAEIVGALRAGADHIGLVRTELLYLDRRELPTEEEQLADALEMVRVAGGRPVTFRTLDIGDDKLPLVLRFDVGPNPALGVRGIRFSLRRPEVFRTQLRALYRAAAAGPIRILLPLVSMSEEVHAARAICADVCRELAGQPHDPTVPIGAMIETPSAVLTADHIAAECDFLSVGTNDLIQYAFAADRQNEEMAFLYQPLHPATLRALELVFAAAKRANCPVSVCGDMAANPVFTWILLGLGLRSFSMRGAAVPFVKSVVRKTELQRTEALARDAMLLRTHLEIEALARAQMGESFALELG